MNKVYFSNEGLTSASANHVANMAKEYAQRIQQNVMKLRLYTEKARLLADGTETTLQLPIDHIDEIHDVIVKVVKCNSLIAWLREAIQEKSNGTNEINNKPFSDWLNEQGIELPPMPTAPKQVGTIEKVANEILNIKNNNRYLELKSALAVYGEFIHPNGLLEQATKELQQKKNNPTKVTGEGRDMVIYSYEPMEGAEERLQTLFFKLQAEHRALQAELNGITHKFETEGTKEYCKRQGIYESEYAAYMEALNKRGAEEQAQRERFNAWRKELTDAIQALRIIIPNDLQGIYAEVNGLTK